MTEYEVNDALTAIYAQVTADSTTVFSLVTAYLVVAYLVGQKLPRIQLIIVNCLFGGWALMATFAVRASMDKATFLIIRMANDGYEMNPTQGVSTNEFFSIAFPFLLFASVIAAYYFMWSVRHPKTE